MKELKKCPNCGFEGLMICWRTMGSTSMNCKCPNCKLHLETSKTNKILYSK